MEIYYSSGDSEVHSQGADRLIVWSDPLLGSYTMFSFEFSPTGSLATLFIRMPIHEDSILITQEHPKSPPLNAITMGVQMPTYGFWGHH